MGRASRKRKESKDVLGVFYTRKDSFVYGHIRFFQYVPGGPPVQSHHHSQAFVVAEILAPGEIVVHGSVEYLMQDIRRLLSSVYEQTNANNAALSQFAPAYVAKGEKAVLHQLPASDEARRAYFEFTRSLAGTLILLSTQARNLFQLFPRLDRDIRLFDHSGNSAGVITLRNLFTHFVHNQYLFLNGEHVSDLFPANPRRGAPISRRFMGYRFNWLEYVELIERALRDVKLRDLTGLLRGRLKKLSLKSPYGDIVFVVQNLYSFSAMFATMPTGVERFASFLDLLFDKPAKDFLNDLKPELRDGEKAPLTATYTAPSIAIHPDLSERKFKVNVRCKWTLLGSDGRLIHTDQNFRDLTIDVGHEELLHRVSQVFGDDTLLDFHA